MKRLFVPQVRDSLAAAARVKFRRVIPALVVIAFFLPGCPIYGNGDEGCFRDSHCANGYTCDIRTGDCLRADSCEEPRDCARNETCSRSGRCVVGDCTFNQIGCVSGYVCGKPRGRWECVLEDELGAGGTSAGSGGAAGESGAPAGGTNGGGESGAPAGGTNGGGESGADAGSAGRGDAGSPG